MSERKKIHKFYFVWDFEKEERWLNEMALSGWVLDKVGFCTYEFVHCSPGEYTVRLEMHTYDEEYLGFMGETGAQYIGRVFQWIFFRKKTAEGPFELFSDLESKIKHLILVKNLLVPIGVLNIGIFMMNFVNFAFNCSIK